MSIIDPAFSPHIIFGTLPNVLPVIARGPRFDLYVNGELLESVDDTYMVERLGLRGVDGSFKSAWLIYIVVHR